LAELLKNACAGYVPAGQRFSTREKRFFLADYSLLYIFFLCLHGICAFMTSLPVTDFPALCIGFRLQMHRLLIYASV
jgi:hypothetical protein